MIYDTIIVGAGCAGVSAAIYAASRGLKTLLIEQDKKVGGLIGHVSTVTHYTGLEEKETGESFTKKMATQLASYPITLETSAIDYFDLKQTIKIVGSGNQEFQGYTVIIASGTTQNELNLPVPPQLQHFISHDAPAEGYKYRNKDIVVVGGSDGAAKEACFLAKIANHVHMIVQEPHLSAISEFQQRIKKTSNLTVYEGSEIISISGDTALQSVEIQKVITGEKKLLNVPDGGIFIYIGSRPNTQNLSDITLQDGYIVTDEQMLTNLPGVFAAGDIRHKTLRQVATAVSDGALAAIQAQQYLTAKP